jgi:hypothetical protein
LEPVKETISVHTILLEVVAPALSGVEMSCRGCGFILGSVGIRSQYRNAIAEEYPEDWKQATSYLAEWIQEIASLYKHRIQIRVIDAQSPFGFWKQIRHRVFRFPAFIVDKKSTYVGWDPQELEVLIDERIHEVP